MFYLTYRVTALLVSITMLMVVAVHLLPVSLPAVTDLNQLYTAHTSCTAGCMLGIQPGRDTLYDALMILQAHPWVGRIENTWETQIFYPEATITWHWSGQQPSFIDAAARGELVAHTTSGDVPHVVSSLSVTTHLSTPRLQAALGAATAGRVRYYPPQQQAEYMLFYTHPATHTRTTLATVVDCPPRLIDYWNTGAIVRYSADGTQTPIVSLAEFVTVCQE